MKHRYLSLVMVMFSAGTGVAEGLKNLHSFVQETKVKGPMTAVGELLYFACEKGGAGNYGYIGAFDTREHSVSVIYEFTRETKVKDGFTRVGDELWFACERGGTGDFGYVGSCGLADGKVTVLHSFAAETKPKTAPVALDERGWYFLTERGGENNLGALMRYTPGEGVSVVASFSQVAGVKLETRPVWFEGKLYYAAREGGDLTQLAGKGAGAIGTIDLATGEVVKLADLNAAAHLAKIRTLLPFGGRLYFTAEEGGDLSLNSGKGFGGIASYEPSVGRFTRILVCDGANTGAKPRGLLAVGEELDFNCSEGGPNGYGTFGVVRPGDKAEVVGINDLSIGSKSDAGITWHGSHIYFVTELGCANYLGGISAFALPVRVVAPPALLTLGHVAGQLELSWPSWAADYVLESASELGGPWKVVSGRGVIRAVVSTSEAQGYYRLRR